MNQVVRETVRGSLFNYNVYTSVFKYKTISNTLKMNDLVDLDGFTISGMIPAHTTKTSTAMLGFFVLVP
jgi:hypothetical protein